MRSQQLTILGAIVFLSALSRANAPPDQYASFNAVQGFIDDTHTHLTWQRYPTFNAVHHAAAQSGCAAQGQRLPTVRELLSIVDENPDYEWNVDSGQVAAHIDPNAFPGTPPSTFWTMSPNLTASDRFKVVDFSDGQSADRIGETDIAYARCVQDD